MKARQKIRRVKILLFIAYLLVKILAGDFSSKQDHPPAEKTLPSRRPCGYGIKDFRSQKGSSLNSQFRITKANDVPEMKQNFARP
jgi:hypothetical protein